MRSGVRHAHYPRRIEIEQRTKLIDERIPWAVSTRSIRRTGLVHEAFDDSMKREAVVKRNGSNFTVGKVEPGTLASGQTDEIGHSFGGIRVAQLAGEASQAGGKIGKYAIGLRRCANRRQHSENQD